MTGGGPGHSGMACLAPLVNLHLDPEGWVTVCAANKREPLGHVADAPLLDLWRGEGAARFRSRFVDGGVSGGCEMCRWQQATAGHDAMYARIYDHLDASEPAWPRHLELTLSSACNLQCVMCNGAFSSSIRLHREGLPTRPSAYDDRFFEQLPPFLAHAETAKFLGGEPFLAPENLRVWELVAELSSKPACHVTTNGTVFNRRVAELLDAVPMSFAVSMDGATAATVERIRAGARYVDVVANLDRFAAHVERNGTSLSLTYCLMTENWHELADFLRFADDRDLPVFVNTVTSPTRLSVYHRPPGELAAIVESLDRIDEEVRARLGRNRAVWDDQLRRLRSACEAPINDGEVPVHFPGFVHPPKVPVPRSPSADEAEAELVAWSGGGAVAQLVVDPTGRIASVEGDLPGVHLGRLHQLGIDELYLWLQSALGRLDGSTYLRHAPEAGDRILFFAGAGERTEVRLVSGADAGQTAWWRVASRVAPT